MATGHEATHGHQHEGGHGNKWNAIFILVLAALLAVFEMSGKSAQTTALTDNGKASDLWNFYQAKTIRQSALMLAVQAMEAEVAGGVGDPAQLEAKKKVIAEWRAGAARYDSDPEKKEGRKELIERARQTEEARDHGLAAYHMFEFASAALEIAIVLASLTVLTEMMIFTFVAGGLGAIGVALGGIGWFAPELLHHH